MHIIQFSHPGAEFLPRDGVFKRRLDGMFDVEWNTGTHHRRLVLHPGSYVDSKGRLQNRELVFWTEWEGCTTATKLPGNSVCNNARYLHRVKYPVFTGGTSNTSCSQNTDPCVLGKTFKYSNCRQLTKVILRNLSQGSLIAFVAKLQGTYYLDTLFVVETIEPYCTNNTKAVNCSDEYRALTLDRLPSNQHFTFYRGRSFVDDGIFSFAPAKFYNGVNDQGAFARCALDIDAINRVAGQPMFIKGTLQGITRTEVTGDTVSRVWHEITDQVKRQGFVLGVHFDWPTK